MKIALIIAGLAIGIPLLVLLGIYICEKIEQNYYLSCVLECLFKWFRKTEYNLDNEPCLTFNQFLSFFNVAPERWEITRRWSAGECEVHYKADDGNEYDFHLTTYGEQLKLLNWAEKRIKRKKVVETAKMMNNFIESVRRDSLRAEEEANKEAQKIKEIRERLEAQKGEGK